MSEYGLHAVAAAGEVDRLRAELTARDERIAMEIVFRHNVEQKLDALIAKIKGPGTCNSIPTRGTQRNFRR